MKTKEQLIRNFLQELNVFVNYKISAKVESHDAWYHSKDKKEKEDRHNKQAEIDRRRAEESWDMLVKGLMEIVK